MAKSSWSSIFWFAMSCSSNPPITRYRIFRAFRIVSGVGRRAELGGTVGNEAREQGCKGEHQASLARELRCAKLEHTKEGNP